MQKKGLLILLVALLGIALIATGCGNNKSKELTTWEKIMEDGKLVVGLDDSFKPMGYRNEQGELIGFDIEMGEEIGKRLGIEVEWQPTEWKTVVASLQSKRFDVIISGMNMFEERKKVVNFAGPYGFAQQVILVPVNSTEEINDLEDLRDKTIGVQLGSTGEKNSRSLGFDDSNMKLYDAFPQAFNDLDSGRTQAIVIDGFAAPEWLKSGKYKKVGTAVGETSTIGIAVRKEDKELLDKINETLDAMKADGTLKELSIKWIGYDNTEGL